MSYVDDYDTARLRARMSAQHYYPAHSTNAHLNPMIAHTLGKVAMPDKDDATDQADAEELRHERMIGISTWLDEAFPPRKPEPPTTVLDEAADIIVGARADDYGSAVTSFGRIAALWSAYLGTEVTGHDVSQLMILMKASRARNGYHHDSAVDIAGYAALSEQLHQAADDALGSYNTADKEEG